MLKKKNLARTLKKSSRIRATLFFYSIKTDRFQFCESWLEVWRCLMLEFMEDAWSYETQPCSFKVKIGKYFRKYTPDILVALLGGRYRFEEIKPRETIDDLARKKIDALNAVLDPELYDAIIVDADEYSGSIEIANLELLYRYMRHPPVFEKSHLDGFARLLGQNYWSFGDAARLLEAKCAIGIADAWWLIGAGWLCADLSAPLTVDSQVIWRQCE